MYVKLYIRSKENMKFHLGFFLTPKLSYFLLSLFVYFSYKLTKEKLTNLPTYKTYELTKLQNFKLTIYSKQSTSSFFFFKRMIPHKRLSVAATENCLSTVQYKAQLIFIIKGK